MIVRYIQSILVGAMLLVGLGACAGAPDQPASQVTSGAATSAAAPAATQSSTTAVPRVSAGATVAGGQPGTNTVYPPPQPTPLPPAAASAYPGAAPTPPPYNPYPAGTPTKAP